jgi:DNA modification methylase
MNSVKFIIGDAKNIDIDKNSIDLIVTSPPYWGVDPFRYGGSPENQINFTRDKDKFISELIDVTKHLYDLLSNNASMLINIGLVQDIPFRYIVRVLDETDFKLGNTLIWDHSEFFINTEFIKNSLQPWFHLYKGESPYINPFFVKKNKGTLLKFPESNKRLHNDKELDKIGFSDDAFPIEMIEFLINMYSKPRSTILDPFGGSGVAAIAALKNKRFAIINDISEIQIEMAKERIRIFEREKNV